MPNRRLIIPVTERWNEGERDWSFVKDPRQDIIDWERRTGHVLPDGYRRFMFVFNGGRVYPRIFHYNVPLERYPSAEPITVVNPFYSWASAERYWRGEIYRRGTPPDMLFIGCDPGGLEILMSLRPQDYGQIFCWVHSTNIWGTDGNDQIWHQADSFEAFLASLYDEPDESDYKIWNRPGYGSLAKPLVF
jgi:hypothetical protein